MKVFWKELRLKDGSYDNLPSVTTVMKSSHPAPQLPPSHWVTCARAQNYWFCSSKWAESNRAIGLHDIGCHAKLFRAHDDEVRFPGRRCQYLTTGWDLSAFLDTRRCNFVWGIQRTNFRRDPMVPCGVIACAISARTCAYLRVLARPYFFCAYSLWDLWERLSESHLSLTGEASTWPINRTGREVSLLLVRSSF